MIQTTLANVDPMYLVAVHEAGHAATLILAHRALARYQPSFLRVVIRRECSSPYIDYKNREVDDCFGLCEGPDLYTPGNDVIASYQEPLKSEMLAKMEWSILTSLAGPFAEAAARGVRSKANMRWKALFDCGGMYDYRAAGAVLQDYKKASGRRRGLPYFEDQTRDLVLKSWPAIEALAQALLARETLDHDDAYAIVEPFLQPPCDVSFATPAGRF
jgi:hypothetical protein